MSTSERVSWATDSDGHTVVHEERVVRAGTDDADLDAVLGVPLHVVSSCENTDQMCGSRRTPAKPSKT